MHHNNLQRLNNRLTYPINQDNEEEEGEGGARGTLLYYMQTY